MPRCQAQRQTERSRRFSKVLVYSACVALLFEDCAERPIPHGTSIHNKASHRRMVR